jgi:hypothetical protein
MDLQRNWSRQAWAAVLALLMIPGIRHAMKFSVVSVAPDDGPHIEKSLPTNARGDRSG